MSTTMLIALIIIFVVVVTMRRSRRRGPRVTQIDRTVRREKGDER